jgi:large subunit ribosomal protein L5
MAKKSDGKYVPRLKTMYQENVLPKLMKDLQYKNIMQVPKIEKIVVSMGVGGAVGNKKLLDVAVKEITQITGQKAIKTKARKSIANFKLREGMEIGVKVTLRGANMYEFLDRLLNVALPRVKDFRGANPKAFDGRGNYSLGIKEQIIFPEINFDEIEAVTGMNIAVITTANSDDEARALLGSFGMPFAK